MQIIMLLINSIELLCPLLSTPHDYSTIIFGLQTKKKFMKYLCK